MSISLYLCSVKTVFIFMLNRQNHVINLQQNTQNRKNGMSALHNTDGIVLNMSPYGDSSVIAKIYTEKFGIQTYLVNGVRSSKAKSKSVFFQPLCLLQLVVYHRPDKGLQRIKNLAFANRFITIPFDITKSTQSIFMAELLYRTIREEEANPALFRFLFDSIVQLDNSLAANPDFHLFFMIKLSAFLGFGPTDNYEEQFCFDLKEGNFSSKNSSHLYVIDSSTSFLLHQCLNSSINNPQFNHKQRTDLMNVLLQYYQMHLPDSFRLQSVDILTELFN